MDIKTEQMTVSDSELEAINRLTLRELKPDEVFIFGAKVIDDRPTANGRIWSHEWMEANVNKMVGVPILVDHENSQQLKVATIFSAEKRGNAIHAKAFIPLDDQGQINRDKIENGTFKSVSINAISNNTVKEGDHVKVLPGEDDRILEVSLVAVGGCATCEITESAEPTTEEVDLIAYAHEALATERQTFVRSAGFILGPKIQRSMYEAIAEKLAPSQLRAMNKDMQTAYESMSNKAAPPDGTSPAESVTEQIKKLVEMKGL